VDFVVQNWYLFLAAAVSGALLMWPSLGKGGTGGERVTPSQAVQMMNREKAVVVDVCEPGEYAAGHVPGSRNVPVGSIGPSADLPKDKTRPVLVMCATGARASRAAASLRKLGYEKVHPVAGGLAAWREASLPVEKSAA
jgi:rhodanese-related sulfurtransferase